MGNPAQKPKLVVDLKSNVVNVLLRGDGGAGDLKDIPIFHVKEQTPATVLRLQHGMTGLGKSSIMLRLDIPDKGMVILWQTSLAMLRTIMSAMEGAEAFDRLQPKGRG